MQLMYTVGAFYLDTEDVVSLISRHTGLETLCAGYLDSGVHYVHLI